MGANFDHYEFKLEAVLGIRFTFYLKNTMKPLYSAVTLNDFNCKATL